MTPFRREADTWDGATTRELAARPAPDRTVRIGGVPHAAGTVRETIHALVAALQHFAGDGSTASCSSEQMLACGFTADEIARLVPTASGLWLAEIAERRVAGEGATGEGAPAVPAPDVVELLAPAEPSAADRDGARRDVVEHLQRLLDQARSGAVDLVLTVAMSSAAAAEAGRCCIVGIHGGGSPGEIAALFAALEPARRELAPTTPASPAAPRGLMQ